MSGRKTIQINGFTAEILKEDKYIAFSSEFGCEFVEDLSCDKKVSAKMLGDLLSARSEKESHREITEIIVTHVRYCSYDLRSVMAKRSGNYTVLAYYIKKSGKWVLKERKIENEVM